MVFPRTNHRVFSVAADFAFTAALQFRGNAGFLIELRAGRCLQLGFSAR